MRHLSTFLSLLLTPLMAVLPLQAEMAAFPADSANPAEATVPATTAPWGPANALQIRLADPGKATVEVNSSVKGYAIVVTDSSGAPVADVAVAIRLPEDGATGFFTDGAHSAVAYTNSSGVAVFSQVNWGSKLGLAAIRVTAVKGDLHAGALIEQTLVAHLASPPQGSPSAAAQAVNTQPDTPYTIPGRTAATNTARPGTPATVASVQTSAKLDQTGAHPVETAASPEPVVSIVNTSGSKGSGSHSNKKWILLALVAVGAGAGAAVALGGHGASPAAATSSGVSIGTPIISIGH